MLEQNFKTCNTLSFPIPIQIPFEEIAFFSDQICLDSLSSPRIGGGIIIHQAGRFILRKRISLNPALTIFDAEDTTSSIAIGMGLHLQKPAS